MNYDKKFQIDCVIVELLEKKQIKFKTILKSTIQFILALKWEFKEKAEGILLNIIEEYKDYILIPLSNTYKAKSSFLTVEQNSAYESLKSENRKLIINELISIALNNSSYINVIDEKPLYIESDPIINNFTLKFFLSFVKEDPIYIEMIIFIMKSLLYKLNRIIKNNLLQDSYYKELLILIMKRHSLGDEANEILKNAAIAKFLYNELGKIFFLMNINYNISLKNESKNFRKWKSKYEPILENKYDNNIDNFIKNELNLIDISYENQKKQLIGFINEMHPNHMEQEILKRTWEQSIKISYR